MSEVKVDTISERTAANGVAVDGVTIKDSGLTIPSGGTLTVASGGTITNSGTATGFGLFTSYAIIADQKSQSTEGGTFTSGAWRTRDLNTEIADPDGIVSISSNQFTLGAGNYLIRWACPSYACGDAQARLYNITDSSVDGISMVNYWPFDGLAQGWARLVITGSKTFEIQHRCQSTGSTNGFGGASTFGTEQYTTVEIYKEA